MAEDADRAPDDEDSEAEEFDFIDGGVAYNNPAMHLIAKEIKKDDVEIEDIFLLSLGTGKLKMQNNIADQQLFWNEKRIGHCITQMTEETHESIEEFMPENNYLRMQPLLEKSVDFADTSPESLTYLFDKAF